MRTVIFALLWTTGLIAGLSAQQTPSTDRQSPFPSGKRGFCFKNSCSYPVRVGQIGAATGIPCSEGCPLGTICNVNNNNCHFSLDLARVGTLAANSDRVCVQFALDAVETRVFPATGMQKINMSWNGAIYGSANCRADGSCDTGLCKDCTAVIGPSGPVTIAELTLMNYIQDTYSIKISNGANIPLTIKPLSPTGSFRIPRFGIPAYVCGEPGTAAPMRGEAKSNWAFRPSAVIGGAAQYAMVNTSGKACGSGCTEDCGVAMKVGPTGYPSNELIPNTCGKVNGVWSDNAVCVWTDAVGYGNCKLPIPNAEIGGTYAQAFGCWGPFVDSCQGQKANAGCCGCTVWPSLGLETEEDQPCKAESAAWMQTVEPRLRFMKAACPTCYVYPFDDATSLFTCRTPEPAGNNMASYELEFCPSGLELSVVTDGETPRPTTTAAPKPPTAEPTKWPGDSDSPAKTVTASMLMAVLLLAGLILAMA